MLISRLAALLAMGGDNVQIATGTFTGNSATQVNITNVGFKPDILLIYKTSGSGSSSYNYAHSLFAIWGEILKAEFIYLRRGTNEYAVDYTYLTGDISGDTLTYLTYFEITRTSTGFSVKGGGTGIPYCYWPGVTYYYKAIKYTA